MQSKGAIKLLAILLAIACIYQLSFSFKTRSVEKKAAAYAAAYDGDERSEREQYYLDSVQNQPVYNLGFRKFTYKEIKEKELNLGLDLKGGMNVMLEIQVEDVVKSLAGDSKNDPAFIEAMAQAKEGLRTGKDFIGRDALVALGAPKMKRIGMKVVGRGIVREHCDLYTTDGEKIGWASSGTFAPYIGCGVAMGYIPAQDIEIGKHLNADVRGRMVELEIVPMPFYKLER